MFLLESNKLSPVIEFKIVAVKQINVPTPQKTTEINPEI